MTDNIGIANYVVNGKSYTSKNITINSELKTVNVVINDKSGNSKNISCNLENKNQYEAGDNKQSHNISDNDNTSNNNNNLPSFKITYLDVTNLSCTIVYGSSTVITKIPVRSDVSD